MRSMRYLILIAMLGSGLFWTPVRATPVPAEFAACDVTTARDGDPGIPQYLIVGMNELVTRDDLTPEEFAEHEAREYGQEGLWFGLPEAGVLTPGHTEILADGTIEWLKFGFYRDDIAAGDIRFSGTSRTDPQSTFNASFPSGYGSIGFQVGSGSFSAGGCWDFVATSGPATMTFTLWITDFEEANGFPPTIARSDMPVRSISSCYVTSNADDGTGDGIFSGSRIEVALPENGMVRVDTNAVSNPDGSVTWHSVQIHAPEPVEIRGSQRGVDGTWLEYVPSTDPFSDIESITFSNLGCWRITIISGGSSLAFSIWVHKDVDPA